MSKLDRSATVAIDERRRRDYWRLEYRYCNIQLPIETPPKCRHLIGISRPRAGTMRAAMATDWPTVSFALFRCSEGMLWTYGNSNLHI